MGNERFWPLRSHASDIFLVCYFPSWKRFI